MDYVHPDKATHRANLVNEYHRLKRIIHAETSYTEKTNWDEVVRYAEQARVIALEIDRLDDEAMCLAAERSENAAK